ncbi:hypothetical protein Poly41_05740 [Novipirellula artificiosorum]|uniref:Uncharacterized protein n=1 Tax=Novipirellula artificiosorum TaxID=2528016 RepID=A0A5C6E054_9BACT|nr:hypothetical protein Poly41_05740 [Novipirellula artificiosorum]
MMLERTSRCISIAAFCRRFVLNPFEARRWFVPPQGTFRITERTRQARANLETARSFLDVQSNIVRWEDDNEVRCHLARPFISLQRTS